VAILESAETPINNSVGSEDETSEFGGDGIVFNEDEVDLLQGPTTPKKARMQNKRKARNPTEKEVADNERDGLLSALESGKIKLRLHSGLINYKIFIYTYLTRSCSITQRRTQGTRK